MNSFEKHTAQFWKEKMNRMLQWFIRDLFSNFRYKCRITKWLLVIKAFVLKIKNEQLYFTVAHNFFFLFRMTCKVDFNMLQTNLSSQLTLLTLYNAITALAHPYTSVCVRLYQGRPTRTFQTIICVYRCKQSISMIFRGKYRGKFLSKKMILMFWRAYRSLLQN